MSGLTNALQELRAERARAQAQVEKLDQAIAVMQSLNGSGTSSAATSSETSHTAIQSKRIISAASRRKMAAGQKARWAKAKNGAQPGTAEKKTAAPAPAVPKRTMSASARKKIAAFQRARWAKVKAAKKAA
jgi:hypothetical protein